MRVKLDENLPVQLKDLFTEAGHDAATVVDEGLGGASDTAVATSCLSEERVLLTQDLDFSDIRTYPPAEHFGIVVFGSPAVRVMRCSRWSILDRATGRGSPQGSAADGGRPAHPNLGVT